MSDVIDNFFDKADSMADKLSLDGDIGLVLVENYYAGKDGKASSFYHFTVKGTHKAVCGIEVDRHRFQVGGRGGAMLVCSPCVDKMLEAVREGME